MITFRALGNANAEHLRARYMVTDVKNPSLLLVDDSEDDAFFFWRTLHKSGANCSLHYSENGTQALQFLQKVSRSDRESLPRVIFLDLKLPVLNGFEVLEWIRDHMFPPEMQIVVLSGSERQEDKDRATRLGANDYLVKPIKVSDLERLLPGSCWADQKTGASH